jgi:hypothetical protein
MKCAGLPISKKRAPWVCVFCVALTGLFFQAQRASGQERPIESLAVPPEWDSLPFSAASLPSPQNTSDKQSPPQPSKPQNDLQGGTSNDRILWTMPNFLTLENADSIPPLTAGQKFKVTARGVFDPFEFVLIGFVAGINQASDSNPTYGQGMQGYAKRYGTAYADNAIENFMASAVFPSVLHQDPRYYQLGYGGFWRRTEHAVGRVLITRSDSGEKQANYSELVGALAAASISTYTYHPQSERGFGNVVSVWASQMGWDAVTYMIKEFWPDLRKQRKKKSLDLAVDNPVPSHE